MSTPRLPTYIKSLGERRERAMQTAFPAKVISWDASTNVVELEPQFIETWVNRDGTRQSEPQDFPNIANVPVLFPRSGSWSITFPIEPGSFGLVVCTKFSLDTWRSQGQARDPGDLRRFGLSGATFHPVNLHPNASTLSEDNTPNAIDSSYMILGQGGSAVDFVALKKDVDDIKDALDNHTHKHDVCAGGDTAVGTNAGTTAKSTDHGYTVTASKKVKVE